jgi:hypothetical protein
MLTSPHELCRVLYISKEHRAPEDDMTATDIHTLIADAKGFIPADAFQRLTAASQAITANPDLPLLDLWNIVRPAPVAPTMTAAQAARLDQVRSDAKAAGSTITHWMSDRGSLVVRDTYAGRSVTAVIDQDGNLDL